MSKSLKRQGDLLLQQHQFAKAIDCYQKALEKNSDFAEACNNLGNVLAFKADTGAARDFYTRAVQIRPDYAEAFNNLGTLCQQQGDLQQALQHYRKALALVPDHVKALNNMGSALQHQGLLTEAVQCFKQSLAGQPEFAEAHANLGNAKLETGRIDSALAHYRTAIRLAPEDRAAHSNMLLAMQYSPDIDSEAFHASAARMWAHQGAPMGTSITQMPRPQGPERLRIGFVSPDFRRHSVTYFFLPLLKALDRTRIEVFCYAEIKRPDDVTRQIARLADHFCQTDGWNDRFMAETIAADRIAVLVDLAGHTSGNRLSVFALKPAPVQITWLGFPATTGLSRIDYRLTDTVADPPGHTDRFHSERLIRLPDGFLCYHPLDPAPAVGQPPCPATGHITFGSFNNLPKVNLSVVHLWSQLLHAVPESQLVLKSRQLTDKMVRARIVRQFGQQGIDAGRLQLLGRMASTAQHLALYKRIDIALDTFPYNGTTTTCEALWMGVPVITLCGNRHAARVGASILTRIGLPELIAENPDAFVYAGTALAADPARLDHLRVSLRQRMQGSALCNAEHFAANLVSVFESLGRPDLKSASDHPRMPVSAHPVRGDRQ